MYVVKRNGRREPVHFDKITTRIQKLCFGLSERVEPVLVAQKVCVSIVKGIKTEELDELASEVAAHMCLAHPDYSLLAGRIAVSNLHKQTTKNFLDLANKMYHYVDQGTGLDSPLLSTQAFNFIVRNADALQAAIVTARDLTMDYFAIQTLKRSYLLKCDGKIVERPGHMFMRVAVGIWAPSPEEEAEMEAQGDAYEGLSNETRLERVIESYNLMSRKFFTHASPTLFNSGTPHPQMSSCFLLTMKDDSIEGIYSTLAQCAQISKYAGGIGLAIHNIRATGSTIRGTNGTSNGIVPMLRVYNASARYVDQGGGKRKGAIAIYLEPHHADIFEFLQLKKPHGVEEERCRDLFLALWTSDLFMERVQADANWSLFCPNEAPGLSDVYGDEYKELYESYERQGKARKVVKARKVWQAILESQVETGTPYMLYKDACNKKSNQKNLGTIRSSNLCTEIIEYTAPDETAVCNLASIALPKFVSDDGKSYDHQRLFEVTKFVTRNLNRVIDINFYPVEEARRSNMRHRPIGLGVQGLADTFAKMRLPFTSPEAQQLNVDIFSTIYFGALTASMEAAKEHGAYSTFEGSPASQGLLQQDLWLESGHAVPETTTIWDWDGLREQIKQHGLRNSLLLAPMPTASTSQILGNNECIEPFSNLLQVRRTLAGEFPVLTGSLLKELVERGLWTKKVRNQLIADNGSIQNIRAIPQELKDIYKTVWELKGKDLISMAADRGAFIDQSQSLNVHMSDVNFGKLTSSHFYAWKRGLKTGQYYLRTRSAADAIKFTVDQELLQEVDDEEDVEVDDEVEEEEEDGMTKSEFDFALAPSPKAMPAAVPQRTPSPVAVAPATSEAAPTEEEEAAAWRKKREQQKAAMVCSLENREECTMCGS